MRYSFVDFRLHCKFNYSLRTFLFCHIPYEIVNTIIIIPNRVNII